MKFTAKTPRNTMKIAGQLFAIAAPFDEGHALTANEASAMNQLLAENIRNNFAKRVKDADDVAGLQAELDNYVKEYEFGVRRSGGGRTGDPVEAEAMAIARSKVKQALQAKGHKLADISASKITELASQALAKHPEWTDLAVQVVSQRDAVADVELEGLE